MKLKLFVLVFLVITPAYCRYETCIKHHGEFNFTHRYTFLNTFNFSPFSSVLLVSSGLYDLLRKRREKEQEVKESVPCVQLILSRLLLNL